MRYVFHGEQEAVLALRIPGWSRNTALTVNGEAVDLAAAVRDGYAMLNRQFHEGDVIELTLDMTPRKVFASSKIPADTGCAAVQRGPLVYCAEGVDNGGDILSLSLNRDGALREEDFDAGLLGGVVPVLADGWRTQQMEDLYTASRPGREKTEIRMVPYYTWGNRGLNQMRVWLPEA